MSHQPAGVSLGWSSSSALGVPADIVWRWPGPLGAERADSSGHWPTYRVGWYDHQFGVGRYPTLRTAPTESMDDVKEKERSMYSS